MTATELDQLVAGLCEHLQEVLAEVRAAGGTVTSGRDDYGYVVFLDTPPSSLPRRGSPVVRRRMGLRMAMEVGFSDSFLCEEHHQYLAFEPPPGAADDPRGCLVPAALVVLGSCVTVLLLLALWTALTRAMS